MRHDAAMNFLASNSSQNSLSCQAAATIEYNRTILSVSTRRSRLGDSFFAGGVPCFTAIKLGRRPA
jgi:hypothetical protein